MQPLHESLTFQCSIKSMSSNTSEKGKVDPPWDNFLMGKLPWSHFCDAVLFFRSTKTNNKRCLFAANIYKTTNLQYQSSEAIGSCLERD